MAFSFKAASISVVAFALSVAAVFAQDTLLEDTYGQGVHEFNKGNYAQAIALFSAAIDGGYQEPTVYYFRGFATAASGDTYSAKTDFAEGARLEAKLGTDPRAIGLALQRLQGSTRVALETERRVAKIAVRAEARAKEKARYGDFLDNQNRVLRNPQGAGDTTETIETPTDTSTDPPTESVGPDPFGGTTTPTEPTPGKGSDPFGGDPLPEPGGSDPFGGGATPTEDPKGADPFGGDTPAEDPKGADPFGGDTTPAEDPKGADPFGGGVDPAPVVKPAPSDDPFGGGTTDETKVVDPFDAPREVDPTDNPGDVSNPTLPGEPSKDPFGGPGGIDPSLEPGDDPTPGVGPAKPADPFGGGVDTDPPVKPVVDDPFGGGPDTAPPVEPAEPVEGGKSGGVIGSIFKAIGGSLDDGGEEPKDSPFIDEPGGNPVPEGGAPSDPFGDPIPPGEGGLKPATDPFGEPLAPGDSEPAGDDPFGAPGTPPGVLDPAPAVADPFGEAAPGESEPDAPADPFDS